LILLLADSLCGKWTRAKDGVSDTKPAFEELTKCLDASLVQEWTEQERVAMEQRGDHLKIYQVASEKRREIPLFLLWYRSLMQFIYSCYGIDHSCNLVPTLAEIRLKLSETEVRQGNLSGAVSALTEALSIEKSQ